MSAAADHRVRRRCREWWQAFWNPEAFHAWRWRAVAAWIIVFTLVVAWSLQAGRNESTRNDHRFCAITTSFINSNLVLRDTQNQASIQSIGERVALIDATNQIISYLTRPPVQPRTETQRKFNLALIEFLRSQNRLHRRLNESSVTTLEAADTATTEWEQLKARLHCH